MLCGQTDGRQTCRCADTTPPRGVQEIRRRVSNPPTHQTPKTIMNHPNKPFLALILKKAARKISTIALLKKSGKNENPNEAEDILGHLDREIQTHLAGPGSLRGARSLLS